MESFQIVQRVPFDDDFDMKNQYFENAGNWSLFHDKIPNCHHHGLPGRLHGPLVHPLDQEYFQILTSGMNRVFYYTEEYCVSMKLVLYNFYIGMFGLWDMSDHFDGLYFL